MNDISQKPTKIKHQLSGMIFFSSVLSLTIAIFYFALTWMLDEKRLPLSNLALEGDFQHVSEEEVQKIFFGIENLGTFMSQDIDIIQESIEDIPWAAKASVRKQWPDTIKVFLIEHQVSAIWNGNELLNEHGDVFGADIASSKKAVVKLYGPKGTSKAVLIAWQEMSPRFKIINLDITSLLLNERNAWQVILSNNIRLELGKESLDERINRFIALYQKLENQIENVSYMDLRYDTGVAIGWLSDAS